MENITSIAVPRESLMHLFTLFGALGGEESPKKIRFEGSKVFISDKPRHHFEVDWKVLKDKMLEHLENGAPGDLIFEDKECQDFIDSSHAAYYILTEMEDSPQKKAATDYLRWHEHFFRDKPASSNSTQHTRVDDDVI